MSLHRGFPIALVLIAGAVVACGNGGESAVADPQLEQARDLARRIILVDTHIDVPYRLHERMENIAERTESGDFDYPRAVAGGLDAAFFAIFVPASFQETGGGKALADELIDMVDGIVERSPDRFFLAGSVQEVTDLTGRGRIGVALGMENGAGLEGELANLEHFYERGIRYISLAHSKANRLCDSSQDEERPWGGLSPFGRSVVLEMNRLGMMVDVSHASDEAFFQILELSRAPVIASHSSCRYFTPGFERNLTDEMIRRLADRGGVIQINFGSMFVSRESSRGFMRAWREIAEYLDSRSIAEDSEEAEAYRKKYFRGHRIPLAGVSDVADHIDHVVQLVGIDHVGLGSDFDGVGETTPVGLKSVADYPNLLRELLARGYSEAEVEKICGGNLLRVWSEVEGVAAEIQAGR